MSQSNKIEEFMQRNQKHKEHDVAISKCLKDTRKVLDDLDFGSSDFLSYIPKVMLSFTLHSVYQNVDVTLYALKSHAYSTAEALSRVAIEHSVNLIYLLSENTKERGISFIKSYLERTEKASSQWQRLAADQGDETGEAIASQKAETCRFYQKLFIINPGLEHIPGWPVKIFDLFKSVGLEGSYRTIYASGSNSVHSLSEDIFNIYLNNHPGLPREVDMNEASEVERMSFAVFLSMSAVYFFNLAIVALAVKMEDEVAAKRIVQAREEIEALLSQHHEDLIEDRGPFT